MSFENCMTKKKKYKIKPNGKKATGRPPKYDDPEVLQAAIDHYFELCRRTHVFPILEDLALALGYCEISAMEDSLVSQEFSHIYKRVRTRLKAEYLRAMLNGQGYGPGYMFILSNMGRSEADPRNAYINPQRIEYTGKDAGPVEVKVSFEPVPHE